jgi:hypothetical protein
VVIVVVSIALGDDRVIMTSIYVPALISCP